MKSLNYNQEESKFVERVHLVFPKVELDPEVAIGALQREGETFIVGYDEPLTMEAFFRGLSYEEIVGLWEKDKTVFHPSQFKPLPWWEVRFEDIQKIRGTMDGMIWMSPYGRNYYLPFFILATIHDLSLNRQHLVTEFNQCFVHNDMFECLIPPNELKEKDCWEEVKHIDPLYKDPRYKKNLYGMGDSLKFLIFISFLNEEQKRFISEFMKFTLKKEYRSTYAEYISEEIEEQINKPKSCWSFA